MIFCRKNFNDDFNDAFNDFNVVKKLWLRLALILIQYLVLNSVCCFHGHSSGLLNDPNYYKQIIVCLKKPQNKDSY